MKALKIFTNMLVAGLYGGVLFVLLVFYLNPELRPRRGVFFGSFPALGLTYALGISFLWAAVLVAVRSLWRGVLAPRWISYRYTIWMLVVNLGALSFLYGFNRWSYRRFLPPELARLLSISTALLVFLLAFVLYLAIAGHPRALRWHRFAGVLAPTLALALIWWLRASYHAPPDPPYTVELPAGIEAPATYLIGIDAATLDLVVPIAARGNLPNLSRILREGAHGRLQTIRPSRPEALWASLSSGKLPHRHGLYGERGYRVAGAGLALGILPRGAPAGLLTAVRLLRPLPPGTRVAKVLGLEEILRTFDPELRAVNWKGSPREAPIFPEGEWRRDAASGLMVPVPAWESPGFAALRERLETIGRIDPSLDFDRQDAHARTLHAAVQEDLLTLREARRQLAAEPHLFAVRFQGLSRASRVFLRYSLPGQFGNVGAEWTERYGTVLDSYYRFLDDICGMLLERLPEEGRLFVVSAYGVEPLGIGARLLSRLTEGGLTSGGQGGAPDGIFLAAGPGIAAGAEVEEASILDFVPTLLYSLGLPVGRDMDGRSRVEVFDPAFTSEHPVFLIPSYEGARVRPAEEEGEGETQPS